METCWADSARARANMRAAFLGGGGGGAEESADELRERRVRSFEESGATTPSRDTKTQGIYSMKNEEVREMTAAGRFKVLEE